MKALFLSKKPLIYFVSFSLGLIYLAFFVAVGKGVVSGGFGSVPKPISPIGGGTRSGFARSI